MKHTYPAKNMGNPGKLASCYVIEAIDAVDNRKLARHSLSQMDLSSSDSSYADKHSTV